MKNLKNKKILYLVTQTKWGGAQKYVLELAQYFAKNNEVHLAFGEITEQNQRFLTQAKKIGVKTIPLKNLVRKIEPTKEVNAIFEIKKLLAKENYNLVHLNSSKAGLLGAIAAKLHNLNPLNMRLRTVYTAHGFVFNEPLAKIEKTVYKISEKFSTSLENAIITVSDFDRQSAIENKICNPNKMITIHNGLNFSEYDFLNREQAREKLALEYDKKYFGTIASFYKTKGHTYLIEAIKLLKEDQPKADPPLAEKSGLLKNHQFIFIGDGPEEENIKNKIQESKLEEYIKIIKSEDNDWKYLKAFDYFILPSVKEGLPYTILEAGLAGVPTIASNVGGIPEIITNQETGLLTTPANPPSLLKAIKTLAADDNLATKLAKKNKENIEKNFSLTQTLEKIEEIYLRLF
ncbi:glycosyltransferase family 4 protein [Candidatus Nomurabacteria bacterium]|nr:glycosyltransferase family 4 protein [Candidatus Nomurabacteria bacterium]